jgi:tRNA (guanine37-N1)-methyltransferase
MLQVVVITLFPEMVQQGLSWGITGRAQERQLWALTTLNPRSFTHDNYARVDERPYGGGPGMVMLYQPLADAIAAAKLLCPNAKVILMSPLGKPFVQATANEWATRDSVILLCGRYEGIDQRLIDSLVDEQVSLGDFVITGGELAAMGFVDATVRLLPGAMQDAQSTVLESFMGDTLDYPHYTRPPEVAGLAVPPVLLSGDHAAIARWRATQALELTQKWRPDLLLPKNGL